MKQIITVLAILISGIASAQTELYTASICGGGSNPRHVDFNGLDYVLTDDYAAIVARDHSDLVCLSRDNNINNNWRSYFENYHGARVREDFNFNRYIIDWPNDSNNHAVIHRRQSSSGYDVIRRSNDVRGTQGRTSNARDALNYALRR